MHINLCLDAETICVPFPTTHPVDGSSNYGARHETKVTAAFHVLYLPQYSIISELQTHVLMRYKLHLSG